MKDITIDQIQSLDSKSKAALTKCGIKNLFDLIYYFPKRYIDRKNVTAIRELYSILKQDGEIKKEYNFIVKVVDKRSVTSRNRQILNVTFSDDTGFINCAWFHYASFYNKKIQVGEQYLISGKPSYRGKWEIAHPDYQKIKNEDFEGKIVPFYQIAPEMRIKGIDSSVLEKIIFTVLTEVKEQLTDLVPVHILEKFKFPDFKSSIMEIHKPSNDFSLINSLKRLKFEEFFYLQLLFARRKQRNILRQSKFKISDKGLLFDRFYDLLTFELTDDQKKTIKEIYSDLRSGKVMNRLLQGDVGSGKTIVALSAVMLMVGSGFQCAVMAPTEILAEQLYLEFKSYCKEFEINISFLSGGLSNKLRDEVLNNIANGVTDIAIGTHALFQKDVLFSSLGLVIIDEQHRFGVMQRGDLIEKGDAPHVLSMSATPIPRTVTLSIYGDLDVSIIKSMPSNRKKIITKLRSDDELNKIYDFIKSELDKGNKAYIIFPLVEKSEKSDLSAASDQYFKFKENQFKDYDVFLLHGKMRSIEKEEVMQKFKSAKNGVLVSTTVVEVGVDVKEATVILIMHAERFGLAQLHQLRGRVGRNSIQSYCILNYSTGIGEESMERLKVMEETSDGFSLSEKDFEIRGPGEFLGDNQSGYSDLKIANLFRDRDLLEMARKEAFQLLSQDFNLSDHQSLRDYMNKKFGEVWDILKY
ncbi:MAG: ATP-dependent DNA helicase RecG [Candidatus Delongbacteria bacterium]|nr:ATP-dependent DNA helicase RecG [Candidatus Delongbacteria bacterium]MBN2835084.1 ATP-dependent DNA helicase RecG [Candidatus Delongbacteria bacterium]